MKLSSRMTLGMVVVVVAALASALLGYYVLARMIFPVRLTSGSWPAAVLMMLRSDASVPTDGILLVTLIAGLVAILVAALLAMMFSRSITRPLAQMAAAVENFGRGSEAVLPAGAPAEIGVLVSAFHRHLEREQLFNAVVRGSSDAILTKSLDGLITAWNRAAETLYGYTAAEAVGRPVRMLVPDDRLDEFETIQARFRTGQQVPSLDTVRLTKAGRRIDVSLSVSPLQDQSGEVTGASEISRDIASRKRAEALFRSLVEASPAAMLVVDPRGRILLANGEAQKMFGFVAEELVGKPVEILIPERFRTAHTGFRMEFEARPNERKMGSRPGFFGRRRDGSEFPVEVGLNPVQTPDGPAVLSVVVDVTAREQATAELEHRTQELQRSNEELQQFAYVASHDLQEPLRMVSSFCELLKEKYQSQLDGDALEYIGFAVDGAQRMRQLIRDLLDYSRLQTRDIVLSAVSAGHALDGALFNLSESVRESGAEIRRGPLPEVLGDEGQLIRVFQNLIGNALKFRSEDVPKIAISAVPKGDDWLFSVQDNGIGMDPKQTQAIFGVFHRLHTREEYPGTGIGLAICKRIVERQGGEIWAESSPGEGSTFYFLLRAAAGQTGQEEPVRIATVQSSAS